MLKLLTLPDRCPERIEGPCVFRGEQPGQAIIPAVVFHSYPVPREGMRGSPAKTENLREYVEDLTKRTGGRFIEFTAQSDASTRCEGMCLRIQKCGVLVADISPIGEVGGKPVPSPNVMFEVGIAWGNRREVILASTEEYELPELMKGLTCYQYPQDFKNNRFDRRLRKALRSCSPFQVGLEIADTMSTSLRAITAAEALVDDYRLCSAYPSFHYRSPESARHYVEQAYPNQKMQQQRYEEHSKRVEVFLEQLTAAEETGISYRELYHRPSFEEYLKTGIFKNGPEDPLPVDLRTQDMQNLIDLVERYFPRLSVGFTTEQIPYNWMMRPRHVVYVDAHSPIRGGVCGLVLANRESLERFSGDFDTLWQRCSPPPESKSATLDHLQGMLSLIH